MSQPEEFLSLRGCPDCGLVSRLPVPRAGFNMHCTRCEKTLRRVRSHSMTWTLACALTGLMFYVIVIGSPFIDVLLYGRLRSSTIMTGIQVLIDKGLWSLAGVIIATAIIVPLIKLAGLATVLINLHLKNPPRWTVPLFRHLKYLHVWAMVEIYLLGSLVAYTRLHALAQVELDTAVFALIGLVLSMVMIDAGMDSEAVWDAMRDKGLVRDEAPPVSQDMIACEDCHQVNPAAAVACSRCNGALHIRKTNSLSRSWALAISAAILYLPANLYPFMQITKLDRTTSYTIFRGVEEFVKAGLWPLALLVFIASIVIPLVKLLSLVMMMIMTQQKSSALLRCRARLYRFIEFIGRWSMIDIFMMSILVGLMQFGPLARIAPEPGAIYFASVVILTMFAVASFDPRLMWDVKNKNALFKNGCA